MPEDLKNLFSIKPYSLPKEEKNKLLFARLLELTNFHREHCQKYRNFLQMKDFNEKKISSVAEIPFFPVRLFKEYELLSINRSEVFKIMTSSGTTGQKVSKIFLDKDTAMLQQQIMLRLLGDFWGTKRLPMLVIDSPKVINDRNLFSARSAAVIGLSFVARETIYALNQDMTLNLEKINYFCEKYSDQRSIIFGFTFMVWQHLYKELLKNNLTLDLPEAFLMTGGGWKKLISEAVTRQIFKEKLNKVCGIRYFLDHYAMVEQTGCLYAECEKGNLHASIYSDIFIRDYKDFSLKNHGERGIIQVVSMLPQSYPGHSLLTEDEGIILGEDDCPCGRKGKYFEILGRVKHAEIRGCSDTYGQ
jgi:phenylacetate-coenzyme A ligase PaaK-like adenylate-forming protein